MKTVARKTSNAGTGSLEEVPGQGLSLRSYVAIRAALRQTKGKIGIPGMTQEEFAEIIRSGCDSENVSMDEALVAVEQKHDLREFPRSFARLVTRERKRRGWTGEELARKTRLSARTIEKIENCESNRLSLIGGFRLARLLDLAFRIYPGERKDGLV